MKNPKRILKSFFIFLLIFTWYLGGLPSLWYGPHIPSEINVANATSTVIVLTTGTTWTVPSDWNNSNNTIEAIGAGGNGSVSSASKNSGAGGGGGEYRKEANVSLTAGSPVDIHIPSGGDGSSVAGAWIKNGAGGGGSVVLEAKNGGNASGKVAGSGGTGGTGTAANFNGGSGGTGATGSEGSGAGGGGSAGPIGTGQNGASGVGGTKTGGGGGGGSDGGLSSNGNSNSGTTGGSGGNGTSGSGGGLGGSSNGNNAGNGTVGGGGGGGGEGTGSGIVPGGNGGLEDLWATGEGPSGGGGGGGGAGGTSATGNRNGGSGGSYGGGGGGAGFSGSHVFTGGIGGQGIIIITYTPLVLPTITTQAATSVKDITTTANGDITDTGGLNNDKEGFVYDTITHSLPGNVSPGSSGYATFTENTGNYGTGTFTVNLTGLSGGSTYYGRAYSHNSVGYSYGNEVSFTTAIVSISITSSGVVSYGFLAPGSSKDTTSSGLNDTQTTKNDGTIAEDFNIEGQNTSCPWTLAATSGTNQYVHEFSTNSGTTWTPLSTSYQSLTSNISTNGTQNFDLRLITPTSTNCITQQSVDITIQAVAH